MRRITPLLLVATLTVAACGSDTDSEGAATTAAPSTEAAADEPTETETAEDGGVTPNPDKPTVEIPGTLPTELVSTELRAGDGEAAVVGDTAVVHYVGVRSEDGTEFDSSWDRGSPFPVQLGSGQVIQGWEEGLVGTQAGGQYQLDIPADLAYGDSGAGEVILPGDAITFVIDVLAIITPSAAEDQPELTVPTSEGASEVGIEDLVDGEGDEVAEGDTVYIDIVAFRGDTGEQVDSSWGKGGPFELVVSADSALPGLVTGIPGMKVGGRRQLTIPAAQAFGEAGATEPSIPGNTDIIIVVDLVAAL